MSGLIKYQPPPYPIDISYHWETDPEYEGIFPKGTRNKSAHFSPDSVESFLIPNYRYLFKESDEKYPSQFWSEIIAYKVGIIADVEVPPAFVAVFNNPFTGKLICGSLIEWFYNDKDPRFIEFKEAGELLTVFRPDFDRKTGNDHNIEDCLRLLKIIISHKKFSTPKETILNFIKLFLFDIILGNTDRHQDNWGFILERKNDETIIMKLAPAYDNGTSLGHEIVDHKVSNFNDNNRRHIYINKGKHHIRNQFGGKRIFHHQFLKIILDKVPSVKEYFRYYFRNIDLPAIEAAIQELTTFDIPVPLTSERADIIFKLIKDRILISIRILETI